MMTLKEELKQAFKQPLEKLLNEAWSIRKKYHPNEIKFYAPSSKYYEATNYKNDPWKFVTISVTGDKCNLKCDHCKGNLLKTMHHVNKPEEMIALGNKLLKNNCEGVLISGGADQHGEVPLLKFKDGIIYLKKIGLNVIAHTGLISSETASMLKRCKVDQVLLDLIGDRDTIRNVYHLNKTPEDYEKSLSICNDFGLEVAPHIVIGLDYGSIIGEIESILMLRKYQVQTIILVVLVPLKDTPMSKIEGPSIDDIAKVISLARIYNPRAKLQLGCARPPGKMKVKIENHAVKAGVNGIAYPSEQTVEICEELGFITSFNSQCCSML
ncbi:MAG: hypothetical protein APF76_06285 [Desulfitibacter sp. BRH_c19]|nr:MAG: hypothetical protein APF76_06285 [Desulfitibacter sp. BRH_c19]